jgi:hypothetical protein
LSFARDKLKENKSYYLIFSPLLPANIGNDTTNKNRRLTCQRIDMLNVILYILAECKTMNGRRSHLIFGWIGMKKTMMKKQKLINKVLNRLLMICKNILYIYNINNV